MTTTSRTTSITETILKMVQMKMTNSHGDHDDDGFDSNGQLLASDTDVDELLMMNNKVTTETW